MKPLLIALAFLALAAARADDCPLPVAEEVVVTQVNDGTLALADGRRLRLAAIQMPASDWPLAQEARAGLTKRVFRKRINLAFDERSVDRHGDVIAHVFLEGKHWLQGDLVADGLARVHTHKDVRACAGSLLERERDARAAKKGLWAHAFYRLRTAEELMADIGTMQIIEGKPLGIVTRRDRTYLNFGADYRTDFTATIARRDLKRFAEAGADPAIWKDKRIRVRGWLSLLNGPEIELTHPEQVELLE